MRPNCFNGGFGGSEDEGGINPQSSGNRGNLN
jgi:hypothetical protein